MIKQERINGMRWSTIVFTILQLQLQSNSKNIPTAYRRKVRMFGGVEEMYMLTSRFIKYNHMRSTKRQFSPSIDSLANIQFQRLIRFRLLETSQMSQKLHVMNVKLMYRLRLVPTGADWSFVLSHPLVLRTIDFLIHRYLLHLITYYDFCSYY